MRNFHFFIKTLLSDLFVRLRVNSNTLSSLWLGSEIKSIIMNI